MTRICPHCGAKVLKDGGMLKCRTAGCGEWKSHKEYCLSGVRSYYYATKHYLSMPRNLDNALTADDMLHRMIAYLKESEK